MSENALPAGHRIGEYQIVRVLGAGGFGITYLAFDHHLDGPVVLKEYFPAGLAVRKGDWRVASSPENRETYTWGLDRFIAILKEYFPAGFAARSDNPRVVSSSPENRETYAWGLDRFIEEARTVHRFRHPNVVRVHRFVEAHGTAYIVMEYVEGESLAALLESRGTLSAAEWRPWLDRLLDGLEHVHGQGYLHRDIKPGNVVVRAADGEPVLIDFGAARVAAQERTHTRVLTPEYAPIEQHSSDGAQGSFTDIYAPAAVSYRALTGEAPPSAPDRVLEDQYEPLARRLNVSAGLSREKLRGLSKEELTKLVLRAAATPREWLAAIDVGLAWRPEDRPQTVAAWRALFADIRGLAAAASRADIPALTRLRKAAELGSPSAQFHLGVLYLLGRGVDQDLRQAATWVTRAAEQGHAAAQFRLGAMYDHGDGVDSDDGKAVAWTRKAAEQGHAEAQFRLGSMYESGDGVDPDDGKAVAWTRKAAEQGHAEAQFQLGLRYDLGDGVDPDARKAVAWIRKAAEQGLADAQFHLGLEYDKGDALDRDAGKAAAWFRRAAEQGLADAQFDLGRMYHDGDGVDQDYLEAAAWYRRAAEQGIADAQFLLGRMYALLHLGLILDDGEGVDPDNRKAVAWYRKAAEQGHKLARSRLGCGDLQEAPESERSNGDERSPHPRGQ